MVATGCIQITIPSPARIVFWIWCHHST